MHSLIAGILYAADVVVVVVVGTALAVAAALAGAVVVELCRRER